MKVNDYIKVVVVCFISIILLFVFNESANAEEPIEAYRVYLNGESIGLISSKSELESYIDNQQAKVKEKYHVDKVYIPNDINVVKDLTYDSNLSDISSIYDKMNNISPFTIKGYEIKIERSNETLSLQDEDKEETDEEKEKVVYVYVLNKEMFTKAVESVVLSFVSDSDYKAVVNGEKLTLEGTGELVEDIYINDEITIKESYIPITEKIYMDVDSLTKYLIFGNNTSDKTYTVKAGDNISSVAEKNSMSVNELLIANNSLTSSDSLLYVGQTLSIGILDPLFSTIVEKHVVADETVKYTTTYKYDKTKLVGYSYTQQSGSNGTNRVTKKIKMVNGDITEAYITSTEELVPVVNAIVIKGGKTAKKGDGNWKWPTKIPYIISSRVGYRWGKIHRGLDICGTGRGSPIYAARYGVVVSASYDSSLGYHVVIRHENGYYTQYGHMQNINGNDRSGSQGSYVKYITVGQEVEAGTIIGEMGSSGGSTGVHLHFEIWDGPPYQSNFYDPLLFY